MMIDEKDYTIFNNLICKVENGDIMEIFHKTTASEAKYLVAKLSIAVSMNYFHSRIDSALELAYWLEKLIRADDDLRNHWRM